MILGFVRELAVSSNFGLSKELDVYIAVTGFYLFFGVQIANTMEMVFISKSANFESPGLVATQLFRALKVLFAFNAAFVLALYIGGQQLLVMLFPGFTDAQTALGVRFLRLILVAIVLANSCGILKASLNVLRVFSPGMLSGAIISLSTAVSIVLFGSEFGINALIYGFIIGNALSFLFMLTIFIRTVGWDQISLSIKKTPTHDGLWAASGIVFLGELCYQGFSLVERSLASSLPAGTISAFYYAWTLVSVPLSLVVMPLSTVVYPKLAKSFAKSARQGYNLVERYGLMFFIFAVSIVLVVLYDPLLIVKMVYMRGKFSSVDAEKTAEILSILIFSLPFSSFGRVARYGLYSLSGYIGSSASQFVTLVSIMLLAPVFVLNFGIIGLAYASSLSISVQSLVMLLMLRYKVR